MRLAAPPPAGIVPIPVLPAHLALGVADVGTIVDISGFGKGGTINSPIIGTKLHFPGQLSLICDAPPGCSLDSDSLPQHTICYSQLRGGPCNADSGGPAFLFKQGVEYIAGVTAFGDDKCVIAGCSTKIDAYESFISSFVGAIGPKSDCESCSDDNQCQTGVCVNGYCRRIPCAAGNCDACPTAGGGRSSAGAPVFASPILLGVALLICIRMREHARRLRK